MSLSLQGLKGALKDKLFPLRDGMTLGRKGDLVIDDQRASSLHARVDQLVDGSYAIVDNNSKNGIKINGQTLPSGPLSVGTRLQIGEQEFIVVGAPAPPLPTPPKPPKASYWYEILAHFIDENKDHVVNARRALAVLNPALVLDFQRGPQLNTKWILGYGPRKIGAQSLDLPIHEPGAPALCFEVIPTPEGIVFKTNHSDVVLLNGKSVDNETLRVGDSIQIHETVIEVDFSE